jgi:transcriptional regulator with XRE-family HTH domain
MDQNYSDDFSGQQANQAAEQAGVPAGHGDMSGLRGKPDGIMDPAGETGWYLERERHARGLSLEDVASCTGIHPYHVEAIEYGDMTHMPPRLEALEMIAAYADFLGFDPDPLLQHYVTFLPRPQVAPRSHPANPAPMMSAKVLPFGRFPKIPAINLKGLKLPPMPPMPGGRNGIVASVAVAFILLSGATWMFSGGSDVPALEQIADAGDPMPTATTGPDAADVKVTDTAMALEDSASNEPVAADGDQDADAALDPAAEGAGDLGAFIAEQVGGEADPLAVAATSKPADIATVTLGEGRVFGNENPAARVVLKATKPIWLLIEDGQGNRVATQMLNPGDMYRVPDREGLVAIAQDGGALVYMIDGVEKGVLGLPGSLLAAEPLDAKALAAKG